MSRTDSGRGSPRAVVHKRILDVAASSPDASMEAIADEVPGATTDLVERVFEEYGDPVSESSVAEQTGEVSTTEETGEVSTTEQPATESMTNQTETTTMQENGDHPTDAPAAVGIDPSSLTDRQRETLRFVHDHPGWTQADIADHLGVSRATVSRRLNDIPGFEWTDRESFTAQVFEDEPGTAPAAERTGGDAENPGGNGADDATATGDASTGSVTDRQEQPLPGDGASGSGDAATGSDGATAAIEETVATLSDRLDGIETTIEGLGSDAVDGRSIRLPPELAHKVLHACLHSERITEDEELRLIEALLEE